MPRPLAIVLLAAASAVGQSSPPPIDPALRARFGFLGPLVHKVGDGIGAPRCPDLDADGAHEVVVHHGRRGRLEVLRYSGDGLEVVETIDTGGVVRGIDFGDVDGDQDPDLLLYRQDGRVEIRLLGGETVESKTIEVGPPGGGDALRCADLDGDGRADALAWTSDGVRILRDLGSRPRAERPIAFGVGTVHAVQAFDADGDGAVDLVVHVADARSPLRIKRGDGRGAFGPWILFHVPDMARVAPFRAGEGTTLATIQDPRRRVVAWGIRSGDAEGATAELTGVPELKRGEFPFATGDFDGDGDPDLVLAHPERAELFWLLEEAGRFHLRQEPAPAGISSLAFGDIDGDGRGDLVMCSPQERSITWKSGARALEEFPERLPSVDVPVTAAVTPDGALLVIARDERRKAAALYRITHGEGGFSEPEKVAELGRIAADPLRMSTGRFDDDDGVDVAFVVPGEGLRVVRSSDGVRFRDTTEDDASAAGLVRKVEDGAVTATGGDPEALFVVHQRFARRLRIDAEGRPAVLEQFNAPAGSEELALGCQLDGAVALADKRGGRLVRVAADGSVRSIELPLADATHVLPLGDELVVLTRAGVYRVRFGPGWVLEPKAAHEPPTDATRYHELVAADLDADGTADLALLDDEIHGVQVLVRAGDDLERALAFPVLELPEQGGQAWEPRLFTAADVDGDGREDLVLVAFDRVLVYLQEP